MRQKLAIAVSYSPDQLEIGHMLADTAAELGFEASIIEHPHQASGSSILLLAGNSRHFKNYAAVIKNVSPKPYVIIWHLEPLPPPQLSDPLDEAFIELAKCQWHLILKHWPRALRNIIPMRTGLLKIIRDFYAKPIKKQLAKTGGPIYGVMETEEYYRPAAMYYWLKQQVTEGWIDKIAVSTAPRMQFLTSRRINAAYVPVGHHHRWGKDLGVRRDIDVLFMGTIVKGSRKPVLDKIIAQLEEGGYRFEMADGRFGKERDKLLSRTKIVLDIPRLPWEMPGMRLLMAMSCKALVVSTWQGKTDPYTNGEHLVCAEPDKLYSTIQRFLENENDRQQLTRAAYDFVTGQLTMKKALVKILNTQVLQ